ncbi:MAG TPA: 3-carboxy-cis,cis-muconate cycloisomerase [Candidatus Dormibacteraeota bacterium]
MRPSSSSSEGSGGAAGGLTGPLFGSPAVDAHVGDGAWVCAMLEVEAALAAAGAGAGVVPAAAAAEIAAACREVRVDVDELGRRALAAGNTVVPLIAELEARLSPAARPHLHRGATSQDVIDTALSLLARRALGPLLDDLAAVAGACARLAAAHRDTPMAARTLLQQAAPTTFGLRCAGWLVAVDEARSGLARVREQRLAVQLGGAAGTLAALDGAGLEVVRRLAAELGLAEPLLPWHTDRVRVAELAAALGTAAGVLGKVSLDVVLLAQSEVGEVSEAEGGSSAMPQKRNPVHAVLAGAAARRTPGLVATLLAAMPQEHERAAGAWHAEWDTLRELIRLTGGAAAHARAMLEALRVDPVRMRENLDRSGGVLMAGSVAGRLAGALGRDAAHRLVRDRVRDARERGAPLREVLVNDPVVREHLSVEQVDAALDPRGHLGSAGVLVDRALQAHRPGRPA